MIISELGSASTRRGVSAHLRLAGGVLAAAAVLLPAPPVGASQESRAFTAEEPAFGGTLVGSTGGAFHRFTISYPGGGGLIIITLDVSDSRNQMGALIGFNVYGPSGLVTRGEPPDGNPSSRRARATFASSAPGAYLVQMENYLPGHAAGYTITADGLNPEAPISVVGAPDSGPPPVLRAGGPLPAGTLTGDSGGAFSFYALDYAGGTDLKATLTYSPPYPAGSPAIGLHLYDGETLLRTSNETDRSSSTVTHKFTYSGPGGATLGLQLFNYAPGHHIAFSIDLTGLGSPVIAITGNTTAADAYVFTVANSSVTGTVPGSRGGGFAYFLLNHPGAGGKITISVTTTSEPRAHERNVGLNVYDGANLFQQALASRDSQSRLMANTTITSSTAKTYGIQLFNYGELDLSYRVNAHGL